ncbi:MAG TPA: hypothetical protein VHV79_02915 [Mycobacteriales bacterium]|nr:hypothetical protein [Mycobacteriales bacterium]
MGLFGKLSEVRMKDGVDGTLKVVGITMPEPTATEANYRLDGVVSAPGLEPTAIVHHGMCSVSKWPYQGQELPVKVDRANPSHIVIEFGKLKKSKDASRDAARQLAEQMRAGGGATVRGADGGLTRNADGSYQLTGDGSAISITIDSGTGAVTTGPPGSSASADDTAPTVTSSADILARGTAGSATLLGTFPTDAPAVKPGHTNVGLMLNVMIDGHAPFQASNLYAVPEDKVARLAPGTLLPVKADLATGLVAVDWAAVV